MSLLHLNLIFLIVANCVLCKNNVKSLTESMGQEVIEIGSPIKELPPGLEEEPSVEQSEERSASTASQLATIKEVRKPKTATSKASLKTAKDIAIADNPSQEDEESRIEKELAEIYKDNSDYKAESGEKEETVITETTTSSDAETTTLEEEKPVARKRQENFQFEPKSNDQKAIETFRTSIDEINCKKVTKKLHYEDESKNSSYRVAVNAILLGLSLFIANN